MSNGERNTNVSIEIYQQDWMPGFAAFRDDGSIEETGKAHVMLNLACFLACVQNSEVESKDLPYLIAESLMHEVIHVLESWAKVEFSEERVEELLNKYRAKFGIEAPHYETCEPRESPEVKAFGEIK